MTAFKTRELKKPSFIQKILGGRPKENGINEINNLLAEKNLKSVTIEDIQTIANNYKINLNKKFRPHVKELYGQYLTHCLDDKHLSEQEIDDLKHLKELLGLNDKEIEEIHNQIAGKIYKTEVDKAVGDGRLDDQEVKFLEKLQKDLKLPEEITSDIYNESAHSLLEKFITDALSDERLSPDEETELTAICKSLNVKMETDEKTQAVLDKYKLYWQIENGDIPAIDVQINFQKSEQCYFHTHCDWLEQRRVTKRINYGGPTMRIKIAKGVYWRAGSLAVQPVSEDVWTTIDSGDLYMTNKRLVFMGTKGNKTIRLSKILDFTAYYNGIDIQKETGKSPFLAFEINTDIFSMILGRAISEL
jgi:envelope transporter Tic110/Armadillo-like protein